MSYTNLYQLILLCLQLQMLKEFAVSGICSLSELQLSKVTFFSLYNAKDKHRDRVVWGMGLYKLQLYLSPTVLPGPLSLCQGPFPDPGKPFPQSPTKLGESVLRTGAFGAGMLLITFPVPHSTPTFSKALPGNANPFPNSGGSRCQDGCVSECP